MDIDKVINTAYIAYKEAGIRYKESSIRERIKYAERDINEEEVKKIERMEKLGLSDSLIEDFKINFEKERAEYKIIIDGLVLDNKNNVNQENASEYFKTVEEFAKSGGSNFYDVASIVHFHRESTKIAFMEDMKKLQNDGHDIKIVDEIKQEGTVTNSIALMMPSSSYHAYESNMIKKYSHSIFESYNELTRKNYFIPPLIESRDKIDKTFNSIIKESNMLEEQGDKKRLDQYLFSGLGYSFAELDTSGGYGVFETYRPDQKALMNGLETVLNSPTLYKGKKRHLNGMMPTLICYSKEDKAKRGIEESDELVRYNLVDAVKGYEIENPKLIREYKNVQDQNNNVKRKSTKTIKPR